MCVVIPSDISPWIFTWWRDIYRLTEVEIASVDPLLITLALITARGLARQVLTRPCILVLSYLSTRAYL